MLNNYLLCELIGVKIMTRQEAMQRQQYLKDLGFYDGNVDGIWGSQSKNAESTYQRVKSIHAGKIETVKNTTVVGSNVIWSAKVSKVFLDRLQWIADQLGLPKADGINMLMACIAWESGRTFSPSIRNAAGSGATGLIQFMPSTAKGLGTTTDKLALMSAEDQLNYVYKYFLPYKGRLKNLGDVYMAILWPAGVGKADSYVLWNKKTKPTTYRQNAGLDVNKNGEITRAECLVKIRMLYDEGKKFIAK